MDSLDLFVNANSVPAYDLLDGLFLSRILITIWLL